MRLAIPMLLAAATAVQAHYRWSKLMIDGTPEAKEWGFIRQTKSFQGNQGISDVNSPDMRCFQMKAGTSTATVAAGDTMGFIANALVGHFGPVLFYMAKAPEGANFNTWDPAGNVWFKVGELSARERPGGLTSDAATWTAYHVPSVNLTIPKSVPTGNYLIRVEGIALHQAQSVGGAQIYLACAQVKVTDGGNGSPGPLVAFPGAYKASDAGLLWSYSPLPKSYTAPGPPIWKG